MVTKTRLKKREDSILNTLMKEVQTKIAEDKTVSVTLNQVWTFDLEEWEEFKKHLQMQEDHNNIEVSYDAYNLKWHLDDIVEHASISYKISVKKRETKKKATKKVAKKVTKK